MSDGWDSGGESSRPVPDYTTNISRGGQSRGSNRGGGGRWNDRTSNDDFSSRSRGSGNQRNWGEGGTRSNDDGGFRGRGRGRGGGGFGRGGRDEGNSSSLSINTSDVGRIIGKGGSKIRELENDSGAEIKVNVNRVCPSYRNAMCLKH